MDWFGRLLDIIFHVYESNKAVILTKAALFCLCWLGDRATIKKTNMLVMCGDKPPAVITICHCTNHMVDGGKKDAEFIMNSSKKRLMKLI